MAYKKFLCVEIDGAELALEQESLIVADDVKYDENLSLRQKIDSMVSSSNFSYNDIELGLTITVPAKQQMFVYQELAIYGELDCQGEVIVRD
jgi:hypothetical protein